MLLTFDANEHELVERHWTVVGHNLSGLHTAQADLAEVLFAGKTCQGHVGQVWSGMFGHFVGRKMYQWNQFLPFPIPTHHVNNNKKISIITRVRL